MMKHFTTIAIPVLLGVLFYVLYITKDKPYDYEYKAVPLQHVLCPDGSQHHVVVPSGATELTAVYIEGFCGSVR